MEVIQKPTFSEILAGAKREEQERIAAHEAQARQAREEASRARVQQIQTIKAKMNALLVQYESQRNALRATFHELFQLEQQLVVVSSGQVSHLPPQLPNSHIPSAFPEPHDPVYSVVPSFQQEIQTWQQTRQWPQKG